MLSLIRIAGMKSVSASEASLYETRGVYPETEAKTEAFMSETETRPRHLKFHPRRDRAEALLRLEAASRPRLRDRGRRDRGHIPGYHKQETTTAVYRTVNANRSTCMVFRRSIVVNRYNNCPNLYPATNYLFSFEVQNNLNIRCRKVGHMLGLLFSLVCNCTL